MNADRQYLARLQEYYSDHRVLPSYAGIAGLIGMRSKASVAEMVQRLKADELLESAPDGRLKPGRRFFDRDVAENVRAGAPSAAADTIPNSIQIDALLIPRPTKSVLIKVKGDSMIDAGILDGDTVVVEKQASAAVGDIVVAIVDDEFTLKKLAREKGQFVLRPANRAYAVIRPGEKLEIFGVVTGLFRKYSAGGHRGATAWINLKSNLR